MVDDNTYVLYDYRDIQYMKIVSDTLSKYHPDSKQVKALRSNFNKELNALNMSRIGEITKNAREISLDPSLKDINGNRISLPPALGIIVKLTYVSFRPR